MKKNIKLATILSYITLLIGNVISLVYTPFMLATLESGEYGLFSLVNTMISYIYLLDMGMGNAIIRYNSKYIANNDKEGLEKINGMFLLLYSFIALIGAIVGCFIYNNLQNIFSQGLSFAEIQKVKVMFIIALINLIVSFPLNVFNGIITANEEFVFIKAINLIRTIINPFIMILVLLNGYRAIGMLLASTVFNIILGLINIIYCLGVLKTKLRFKEFDKKLYKEIFRYSFFIFLSAIAYKLYWSTDQFILGMYVSSTSIAIYSIGTQFNGYFTSFSNVISGMFLPKLTKITCKSNDKEIIMDILIKISRIQFYIVSYIIIGFTLIGKQFIVIWAGKEYESSYYIALLVMIPQIFSIVQSLFATMLEAMNKHRMKSLIYLGVAILNLVLTLIFVGSFGAIGCALGTAIGMIVNVLLNNLYYKYSINLNMSRYWKEMMKVALPMIGMIVIGIYMVTFAKLDSYVDIFIFILAFTSIYLAVCWKFIFNEYEKSIIKSMICKFNNKKFKNKELA